MVDVIEEMAVTMIFYIQDWTSSRYEKSDLKSGELVIQIFYIVNFGRKRSSTGKWKIKRNK